jgi:hypothetical protein
MHISPPKYLNFAADTGPMLIVISRLQKCLKNLPILITNYIPFEKCIILNLEFLEADFYHRLYRNARRVFLVLASQTIFFGSLGIIFGGNYGENGPHYSPCGDSARVYYLVHACARPHIRSSRVAFLSQGT